MNQRIARWSGRLLLAGGLVWAATGCGRTSAGGPPAEFAVQVIVAEAKVQPVTEALSLVGTLAANEQVEVKAETDGTVEEILFQEGQPVRKGALLFRLDETKSAAMLAEAEANYKLSKANLERLRQLRQSGTATQQELDQALASFEMNTAGVALRQRELKDARIVAPFDGVMGSRLVSPGQVISKNAALGSIVSVNPVKVEFNVPERFLSLAKVGQTIEITVAAWPGQKFQGEVFFIAPKLDPDTRTALVKALLPNAEKKLKPGMFANLDVTLTVRDHAVVIPEAALMLAEDRVSVFVVGQDNVAQPRAVKVGLRMPGSVEITQGLQGGEKVIVEGTQKVRPGGKVRLTPNGNSTPIPS